MTVDRYLTADEVRALPDGARVLVTWARGWVEQELVLATRFGRRIAVVADTYWHAIDRLRIGQDPDCDRVWPISSADGT